AHRIDGRGCAPFASRLDFSRLCGTKRYVICLRTIQSWASKPCFSGRCQFGPNVASLRREYIMPAPGTPVRFSEQGRSGSRMLAAVPVVISGKADGKPFEEKTRTVVVNGSGCKLVSEQVLAIGDQMNVAMASGKRSVFATVAWIGERKGKLLD